MSAIRDFFDENYPGVDVLEVEAASPDQLAEKLRQYIKDGTFDPPTAPGFAFTHWPTEFYRVTQEFGANPQNYAQFGLPGHEGVDLEATTGSKIFAVADGVVHQVIPASSGHNYGNHIRVNHLDGTRTHQTIYCHLQMANVFVGQQIRGGDLIGLANNTGNSFGSHLHLTYKILGEAFVALDGTVWPSNIHNPTSLLAAIAPPNTIWPGGSPGIPAGTPGHPSNPPLEPPPDPNPDPPPYQYNGRTVTFHPALHGPADDWAWQLGEVQGVHRQVNTPVKFLSNGMNADYFASFRKPEFHIVRIMWHAHTATPAQFWDEVKSDFGRMYNAGARQFEIHNEPNLTSEGLGTAWADGAAFGAWLKDVIGLIRAQYGSNVKLYYPGCSPGVPWSNQFAFTDKAWPIVKASMDGFCLHAYTGNNSNTEAAAQEIANQVIEAQKYLNLQVPLVVSEASVNRGTDYQQKAQVYQRVEELLHGRAGIEAICWYISDWQNPPPEQAGHGEAWAGTALPDYYTS